MIKIEIFHSFHEKVKKKFPIEAGHTYSKFDMTHFADISRYKGVPLTPRAESKKVSQVNTFRRVSYQALPIVIV